MAFTWNNKPNRFSEVTKKTADEIRQNLDILQGFISCTSRNAQVLSADKKDYASNGNSTVYTTYNTNYCQTVYSSHNNGNFGTVNRTVFSHFCSIHHDSF